MSQTVLGSITLGYRPLWDKSRSVAAIQLFIDARSDAPVDAVQLLNALQELGNPGTPPLLLSVKSPQLLRDLLDNAPRSPYWIEVRNEWMHSHAMPQRVQRAHQRGLRLVWRGEADEAPAPELAACFFTRLLRLSPQAALSGLQAAARKRSDPGAQTDSPVLAGQIYEGIASRLLMEHCLDQQQAAALLGWPDEDVLHALQHKATAPDYSAMVKLVKAVDEDLAVEQIEALLSEEPILTFRFLAYANSAAVGLRNDIESLRHGLMMLGYKQLKRWLQEQMPQGSRDPNLLPVKAAMVLRARLMENLMDAGVEHELAREIYLCGLFSQIDVLMGEALGTALHRVPLSSRIYNATVRNSGPYAPLLQIASAQESDNGSAIRSLCHEHGMGLEDVNRALLHTLSALKK
ncbi:HDOD domain-containing protein [Rhodoferax sp.]|uniref:HDOD domain-containing protein n=1 Tax=Rhodoferax sp. TaxID=50421 RepID=UPI00374D28D1